MTHSLCTSPSIESLQFVLVWDFTALRGWFLANGLALNEDATQIINFSAYTRINNQITKLALKWSCKTH